jgi:hypothetical protein
LDVIWFRFRAHAVERRTKPAGTSPLVTKRHSATTNWTMLLEPRWAWC